MVEPFATVDDLGEFWRPLEPGEEQRADRLLRTASAFIRAECELGGVDLSDVSDDYRENLRDVACMVAIRMFGASDANGVPIASYSQSAIGISESVTYSATPMKLNKPERILLGIRLSSKGRTIKPAVRDAFGRDVEW